jgi:hypothetical protein
MEVNNDPASFLSESHPYLPLWVKPSMFTLTFESCDFLYVLLRYSTTVLQLQDLNGKDRDKKDNHQ